MTSRPPTIAVLDLDGVLIDLGLDTERVRGEIRRLLESVGVDAGLHPLLPSLEESLARLAARDAALAERVRCEAWAIIDEEEKRCARRCRLRPGALELLRRLRSVPVALYTNNGAEAAALALAAAGISVELFFSVQARTGPRSIKPAAEPLLAILEASPIGAVERVFLLGDHPSDMRSAALAQGALAARENPPSIASIGLPRGPESAPRLEEAGAWFLAADLEEAGDLMLAARCDHSLSVVLLAYNEAASIERAIRDARRFCRLYVPDYEIIVVDDGSADDTRRLAEAADEGDLRIVEHAQNQGMGASMRDGYRDATKSYLVHLPGDRQVRPQALARLLERIGPERVVLSRYTAPPSGAARQLMSRSFRWLVRNLGGLKIDFAGTYVFHRRWLEDIALDAIDSRTFLFSFVLLQRLHEKGCTIHQVAIHPFPRLDGASREASPRRIAHVLREILRYRRRSKTGQGGSPCAPASSAPTR